MCGKFTQMASWAEVHAYANLLGAQSNDYVRTFTPMHAIPVVHLPGAFAPRAVTPRVVTPMSWGFTDRKPVGRRIPKLMHARGETVHKLPTFADAFRYRRGVAFAKSFNEGMEIPVIDSAGDPTGKTWTQQWVIRPRDGKPVIMGFVYDAFQFGDHQKPDYECVQVTTPANAVIGRITDRMPLVLREDDLPLWLGEDDPDLEDVMALIRTTEFDPDEWEMAVEDPAKKPPVPRSRKAKPPPQSEPQSDLF